MRSFWILFGDIIFYSVFFVLSGLVLLLTGFIIIKDYKKIEKNEISKLVFFVGILTAIFLTSGYFNLASLLDFVKQDFVEAQGIVTSDSTGKYGTRTIIIDNENYTLPMNLMRSQIVINDNYKFKYALRTKKLLSNIG